MTINSGGRRGVSILEVVVLLGIAGVLIFAACQLSSRNVEGYNEAAERLLVQGVALDALERLKRFKTSWSLPGAVDPNDPDGGTPAAELYGPLETDPARQTLIDKALVTEMSTLGMTATPSIERVEDAEFPGLFKIEVTMKWKPHGRPEKQVTYARYCYAP